MMTCAVPASTGSIAARDDVVAPTSTSSSNGMIADPFGFSWSISTQKETVSPAEMQRLWSAALNSGKST